MLIFDRADGLCGKSVTQQTVADLLADFAAGGGKFVLLFDDEHTERYQTLAATLKHRCYVYAVDMHLPGRETRRIFAERLAGQHGVTLAVREVLAIAESTVNMGQIRSDILFIKLRQTKGDPQ